MNNITHCTKDTKGPQNTQKKLNLSIMFFFIAIQSHNIAIDETNIVLKSEVFLTEGFIALSDIVDADGLSGDLFDLFKTVYLGKAQENRILTQEQILFELRYRNLDANINFTGEKVTIHLKPSEENKLTSEKKLVKALRATRSMSKGHILSDNDFETVMIEASGDPILIADDAIKSATAQKISKGEILRPEMLKSQPLVKKGSTLTVKGTFIEGHGKALKDGALNEIIPCVVKGLSDPISIKIVNSNSGEIVTGAQSDRN